MPGLGKWVKQPGARSLYHRELGYKETFVLFSSNATVASLRPAHHFDDLLAVLHGRCGGKFAAPHCAFVQGIAAYCQALTPVQE